jgi:hypothetical protein
VLSQEAGQPLQGPKVAYNKTYLQGVLSQEAGQSLRSQKWRRLRPTCRRLECSARRPANRSRAPKWRLMRPTCRRLECSAKRPANRSRAPKWRGLADINSSVKKAARYLATPPFTAASMFPYKRRIVRCKNKL